MARWGPRSGSCCWAAWSRLTALGALVELAHGYVNGTGMGYSFQSLGDERQRPEIIPELSSCRWARVLPRGRDMIGLPLVDELDE